MKKNTHGMMINRTNSKNNAKVRSRANSPFENPQEIGTLLSVAHPDLRPCLLIGGFGGLRTSEILRLKWSDIDFKKGFITVNPPKAKNVHPRKVRINETLAVFLAPYAGLEGDVWKHPSCEYEKTMFQTWIDAENESKGIELGKAFFSHLASNTQGLKGVVLETDWTPHLNSLEPDISDESERLLRILSRSSEGVF